MKRFINWLKNKNHRRYWSRRKQLYWLKHQILEDHQWLSANPIARAITQRYLDMVVLEWEKVSVEDISSFRKQIGLDPHKETDPTPDTASQEVERLRNCLERFVGMPNHFEEYGTAEEALTHNAELAKT